MQSTGTPMMRKAPSPCPLPQGRGDDGGRLRFPSPFGRVAQSAFSGLAVMARRSLSFGSGVLVAGSAGAGVRGGFCTQLWRDSRPAPEVEGDGRKGNLGAGLDQADVADASK